MAIQLRDCQIDAINKMHNGCILCGGVGSGKSRTALAYYFRECGGGWENGYSPRTRDIPLYIITTARKRDSLDWERELLPFLVDAEAVDSWNNIGKYKDVKNAFFIFDEQRLVSYGVWTKTFLEIVKHNQWILLSATPGDKWEDYIPVFIANGFYRNKTQFQNEHLVYSNFTKFPQVVRYLNTKKLTRFRDSLLVDIELERNTVQHHEDVYVTYDISKYRDAQKNRWNPYTNKPMKQASELCYVLRQIVNSDDSRVIALMEILEVHPKVIIFYNFDYELDILMNVAYGEAFEVAQWNGHKHQPVPESDRWIYLVQYTAGAEAWNCITTDTIVFYSQNYSYKVMEQASGRIDRMNTRFVDLYYYHFKTRSGIDLAISRALSNKKKFNERKFTKWDSRR